MKKLVIPVLLALLAGAAFGQTPQPEKISQGEYVRMLYAVESGSLSKSDLIEQIRKRGLGFEMNSGLRSLTASKSGNDSEVRRTVEEASRRLKDPEAARLPSPEEASRVLGKAREAALAAVGEMPDFVVKQRIRRSVAYAGTGNFRSRDHLIVAVSYRASGQEEYELLSVNGVRQTDTKPKGNYSQVGGTSSTGEFVSVLETVFKPESDTLFDVIDTDVVRERRAIVFEYIISRDKARQQITSYAILSDSTITGMKGRIWIDRENFRVLKLESIATEIPSSFPVTAASRMIDYDWVEISDVRYLLPSQSDVRLTFRQGKESYESRNLIQFRDYQKFGTEVIITDEDDIVIPEDEETPAPSEDRDDSVPPPPPPPPGE
ncbi:MAG: hypothetical protein J5I65_06090 [Aridibacter famidurans]|nr:hypothetical protein [Aridibacter famidurans]